MKNYRVTNLKTDEVDDVEADYFILKEQQFLIIRRHPDNPGEFETIGGIPASYYSVKLIEK